MLEAVVPVAAKTVVILVHGRPQTFGDNNKGLLGVDAMFAAWRPGEEFGNAMLRLLTGEISPSAKLSVSWPRTVGHVGSGSVPWLQEVKGKWVYNERGHVDPDGRRYDNYVSTSTPDPSPLFYFGHGLSYTKFRYESMVIQDGHLSDDILWEIQITISNIGRRDAEEVVQVYVQDPAGVFPYVPFWKRLIGFTRCYVPAQKRRTCRLSILKEDLASYDASSTQKMRVYRGVYNVSVGGSSNADSLFREILISNTLDVS